MIDRGEKKTHLVIKFLLLLMIYRKLFELIGNKKAFYSESKKYYIDARTLSL